VIIEPSDTAGEVIRNYHGCSLKALRWAGECLGKNTLGEYVWYYVAGTGPLHVQTTHVLVLAK
jgi:hypothetical protein